VFCLIFMYLFQTSGNMEPIQKTGAWLLEVLKNPEYVANFQKVCGIDILCESEWPQQTNGHVKNGSLLNGVNGDLQHHETGKVVPNGCTNGYIGSRQRIQTDILDLSFSELYSRSQTDIDNNKIDANGGCHTEHSQSQNGHVKNGANGKTQVNVMQKNGYHNAPSGVFQGQRIAYKINNKFLYYLFTFGASLGNEIFYLTFFPLCLWNIDSSVARKMCMLWQILMYLGQLTKDIVKWPRPSSPPVVRLEKRYELEYGMPSTHAMVGTTVPFALLLLSCDKYEVSIPRRSSCLCLLILHFTLDVIYRY
jgi:hypothetical protein